MKRIFTFLLVLMFAINVGHTQNADYKAAVGGYLNWVDFDGPLHQFPRQLNYYDLQGMQDGIPWRVAVSHYVSPSFNLEVGFNTAKLKKDRFMKVVGHSLTEARYWSTDLNLKYKFANGYVLAEDFFVNPYVFLAAGFTRFDNSTYLKDRWGVGVELWPLPQIGCDVFYAFNDMETAPSNLDLGVGIKYRFNANCCKRNVPRVDIPAPKAKAKIAQEDQNAIISIAKAIYFDTGSDKLKPESLVKLDELVAIVKKYPGLSLDVQGHTDNVGEKESNQKLSQQRVDAVKAYLVSKGVDGGKITAIGYGETKPIASNDTPDGRSMNRRVEIQAGF